LGLGFTSEIYTLEPLTNYLYPHFKYGMNQGASLACPYFVPVNEYNLSCDIYTFLNYGLMWANQSGPGNNSAMGYATLNAVSSFLFSNKSVAELSDIWGYDDLQTGDKYALVGAANGLSIVDVTVPINVFEVAFFPGPYSIWRDIKTYKTTVYAVNDGTFTPTNTRRYPNVNPQILAPIIASQGLVIVDMSISNTPKLIATRTDFFNYSHNIFVEMDPPRPYLYAVGGDVTPNGGIAIYDITNQQNPILIFKWDVTYIHDVVVQQRSDGRYVAFGSAIYANTSVPGLYVLDVTDPTNVTIISAWNSRYRWTHNSWPTIDGKYLYTTHESNGLPITIWDTKNLDALVEISDLFLTPNNNQIAAHNVHVNGTHLWISYYSQGAVVYDVSGDEAADPDVLAQYDTFPQFPQNIGGLQGDWGIFPYSSSGNVYASDITNGLYVLRLTVTNVEDPSSAATQLSWFLVVTFALFALLFGFIIYRVYASSTRKDANYQVI